MAAPHILILIPELKEVEPDDNLATISTAREIAKHYDRLGYTHVMRHFEYVPSDFRATVQEAKPDCVFNLVESVSGTSRLIHVPPIYMEEILLPYTGSPAHAIELSNDKVLSKKILNLLQLPTPRWGTPKALKSTGSETWIVKAQHEHASFGITQKNVVKSVAAAHAKARELTVEHKIPWMMEEYVPGREFNVSMVETPNGPQALPVAEIVFENYAGSGLYNIVDYNAKWSEQSFEYKNTVRSYDFPASDHKLLKVLEDISIKVWNGFDLRGWARVDFRVDPQNNPYVVDVNANPDLSLDAGFMAAAGRAEITPEEAIRMITDAAFAAA
ncbi:MAG: ATP-grasp domain-containing protein [Micropepsaceae bacterium]